MSGLISRLTVTVVLVTFVPQAVGATYAPCPNKATPSTTAALELDADCGPVGWHGWILSREAYAHLRADLAREKVKASEAESDLLLAWASVGGALALGITLGIFAGGGR